MDRSSCGALRNSDRVQRVVAAGQRPDHLADPAEQQAKDRFSIERDQQHMWHRARDA